MKKFTIAMSLWAAFFAISATAGGPFARLNNNLPLTHDPSQTLTYNNDPSELTTFLDNDAMQAIVNDQFGRWAAIPGNTLQIQEGTDLASDITTLAGMNAALNNGQSPIIFDQDGSIFSELGVSSTTLAFAGPAFTATTANGTFYVQLRAVFGGPAMSGFPNSRVESVVLHELGHALGLAHSVCNGQLFGGRTYREFGAPPNEEREVMFWQSTNNVSALGRDDISGYLSLYGETSTGAPGLGAISGRILFPDGVTPADGVNVVARDRSDGVNTLFANAASTLSEPGTGQYKIVGLPPGQYTVEIEDIAADILNTGIYSDPIRTNNSQTTTTTLGPFPGEPEFYNGVNESADDDVDDINAFTLVPLAADQEVSGINIIVNGARKAGTAQENIYYVPEVQASSTEDTFIGIVNRGPGAANIDVYGFSADGTEIGRSPAISNLDPLAKAWLSVKDAFPDDFANVDWVQVGGSQKLHVYAEVRAPGSLSSYWAADQLYSESFMPHVAKNTALFETYLSSVNGDEGATATNIFARPTGGAAGIPEHSNSFAKSENDVRDFFGDDLSAVDWVQLQSGGNGAASMEYFVGLPERTRVASLGLDDRSGTTLRFLHVAADTSNFWTGLVYMNVGSQQADFTETYYNTNGDVITTITKSLDGLAKIAPIPLFDENNTEPTGTAWVEVTSTQPIVGYELFGSPISSSNDYFVGLQGVYDGGATIDYPHIHRDDNAFTALVALNLGESAGDITFNAYDSSGAVLETSTSEDIQPKRKLALLASSIFSADTMANVAWIRATTTDSNWAGFQLWGDPGSSREFLAGINAFAFGQNDGLIDGLFIVEELEDNNSYDSAQPLQKQGDEWNINVVGSIDAAEPNTPVQLTGLQDDAEDIYSFTLTEPTKLVIAVAPDDPQTDLDLYVTQGQVAINLNLLDPLRAAENFDYAANVGGDESVCRLFPPGDYFIVVSSFDVGNPAPATEYGLLIASQPLTLETFDSLDGLTNNGWSLLPTAADGDGQVNFEVIEGFQGHKFGTSLVSGPSTDGTPESITASPPTFTLPLRGLTLFDMDYAVLFDSSAGEAANQVGYALLEVPLPGGAGFVSLNAATATSPVMFNNMTLDSPGWLTWIGTFGVRSRGLFTSPPGFASSSVLIAAGHIPGWLAYDNLRVFTLFTSSALNKSKRSGTFKNVLEAPERLQGPKFRAPIRTAPFIELK